MIYTENDESIANRLGHCLYEADAYSDMRKKRHGVPLDAYVRLARRALEFMHDEKLLEISRALLNRGKAPAKWVWINLHDKDGIERMAEQVYELMRRQLSPGLVAGRWPEKKPWADIARENKQWWIDRVDLVLHMLTNPDTTSVDTFAPETDFQRTQRMAFRSWRITIQKVTPHKWLATHTASGRARLMDDRNDAILYLVDDLDGADEA